LIGAFGGVAKLVIDLIHGNNRAEATWDYQRRAPFAPEMRGLYEQRGIGWVDYPEIVSLFRQKGAEGINPLLSGDEQEELFETVDLHRMAELILRGMSRS
jgi:SLOG-like protein